MRLQGVVSEREEADVGNVCVRVCDSCWQLSRLQMSVCLSLLLALLFCSKKGRAVLVCVVLFIPPIRASK